MSYVDELFSLRGRSALVTGGNSGIGGLAAEALGRAGAAVHLVARDRARIDDAVARLGALGVEAGGEACDLADEAALTRLCGSDVVARCDVLVTCAGVNHRPPLGETSEAQLQETLAVNLMAPFRLGQAAGPHMAERGFGRIINVGSQQMWMAFGNSGVYGMTKAAIGGLTRSQAEAWSAKGVTANALVPGFVITPMTRPAASQPGRADALAARTLVGRNGLVEDFATAVLFLASPASGYVTGQSVAVDGGFSVH